MVKFDLYGKNNDVKFKTQDIGFMLKLIFVINSDEIKGYKTIRILPNRDGFYYNKVVTKRLIRVLENNRDSDVHFFRLYKKKIKEFEEFLKRTNGGFFIRFKSR